MIYSQTFVLPDRQKLIGLLKAGSTAGQHRDEDLLNDVLPASKTAFKFIMMGTREEDYLKEPNDMDLVDDNVVNDLDIDYSASALASFTPWTDLENLQSLKRVTKDTQINIINDLRPEKKLIVFDLDYTLFDCKSQVSHIDLLARPGLHDMLAVLYPYYEFVIWSQTSWRWLEAKITELGMLQHSEYKIAFVLDQKSM
jgi:ubiquitin-like domain-containing CTD phosphatase 1